MKTLDSIRKGTLLSQKIKHAGEYIHYLFEVGRLGPTDLFGRPMGYWQTKGILSADGGPWQEVPNEEYAIDGAHEFSKGLSIMTPDEFEIWDDYFKKETY